MKRSSLSLQVLLAVIWTFFSIHAYGAEVAAMPTAAGHPMTDAALQREETDPQLRNRPEVRRWLEAVEDDADIRATLSDEYLQRTLNRAASTSCRYCVMTTNLRRVDSETRMAFFRSGMSLLCRRDESSLKDVDLDAAYRAFYLGLQAKAKGTPAATLTPERSEAVEFLFGSEILKVAAKIPGASSKLKGIEHDKQSSDEDKTCFYETLVRGAFENLEVADRDDALLFALGGRANGDEKAAAATKLEPPFADSQKVLDTDFSLSAMPAALRNQLKSLKGSLPFRHVDTEFAVKITTKGQTQVVDVNSACTVVKATVSQCFQEWLTNGVVYMGSFYLGDTYPWTAKSQFFQYGQDASPAEFSLLIDPTRRPAAIKPNARMTFAVSTWKGDAGKPKGTGNVRCQTGGRYAASTILPSLTGMAIDMECTVNSPQEATYRYTLSYLEDLRFTLLRNGTTLESTYVATYKSIETE